MSKLNLKLCLLVCLITTGMSWKAGAQCLRNWKYKVPVTIDNTANATTLTDFQVKVVVDTKTPITAGKMNSSGNDIRFTTSSCTNINYWIESGINTTATTIWLRIPSLTASAKTTINMYYGNGSAAAASVPDSVFMMYDDFNAKNTNLWNYTTGYTYRYASGRIGFTGDANGYTSIRTNASFPYNILIEGSLIRNESCSDHFIYLSASTGATWNWGSNTGVLRYSWDCGSKEIYNQSTVTSSSCSTLQTYNVKATVTSSLMKWEDDKCTAISLSGTTFTGFYIYLGADQDNTSYYSEWDWLRVRKYVASDPTSSAGSETSNNDIAVSLTGTSFCPGASFSVSISTVTTTFNAGNKFTLQLSNASGNFSSATAIGSVFSTTGPVTGTIPLNTSSGSGYRVRVVSTSPADTSGDNGTNLTILPLPTPNAGSDKIICLGNSANIGITANAGSTYKWSPSTGLSSSTISNPVATPTATTQYVMTETNASGCSKNDTVIVTVTDPPAANVGPARNVCANQAITLGGPGKVGYSYSWTSKPAGFSSSVSNPTVYPSATTTYYLTEINVASNCVNRDSVKITVNSSLAPNRLIIKNICSGQSITLGEPATSGNTYSWTSVPSGFTSSSSNPSVTPGSNTTYILTQTVTATNCVRTDSFYVNINSLPTAAAGSDRSICPGASTQIGSTAVSGSSYSWTSIPTGFSSTAANPIITPTATTTYTLTETNISTGCSKTNSVKVTVVPLPDAYTGADKSICYGTGVSIGDNPVSGHKYKWTPSAGLSSDTVANPTASPLSQTTYTLVETIAGLGCTNTNKVTISIIPAPAADAGVNKTICQGEKTQIGSATQSNRIYSWSPSTGLSSDVSSNPYASPLVTTVYTLTEMNTLTGCKNSNTVTVTVNPLPSANTGLQQTLCIGGSVMLGSTAVSGHTYLWKPSKGLSATNVANPVASPNTTTTYTLTEIDNTTSCVKSDSVTVTVLPKLATSISGPTDACANTPGSYSVVKNAASTYVWSVKGGVIATGQNTDKITVLWSSGLTGTVKVIETRDACKDSASTTVNVAKSPNAGWTNTKVGNRTFQFRPLDSSLISYQWDFGDGTTSTYQNPLHSFAKDSIYMVSLTVQNASNCRSSNASTIVTTGINEDNALAMGLKIYPNPFRNSTSISYTLPSISHIRIQVFDLTGKEITTLADAVQSPGDYTVPFSAADYKVSAGMYMVRVQADDKMTTRQIIMLK